MGKQLIIKGADFSVNCIENGSANLLEKATMYYNEATSERKRSIVRFSVNDINDFSLVAEVSENSPYKVGLQARNDNRYPLPDGFFSPDINNPSTGMPTQSIYDSGWILNGSTNSVTNENTVGKGLTSLMVVFTDIATGGSSQNAYQTAEELSKYIKLSGHNITIV